MPEHHRRRRTHRRRERRSFGPIPEVWAVAVVAVLSAAAGSFADASPTGWEPADAVLCAGFAGVLSAASAAARRSVWLVLTLVTALMARGRAQVVLALTAVAIAFIEAAGRRRRDRVAGAVIGACCAQVLLRAPSFGIQGLPTLIAIGAIVPVLVSAWRHTRPRTHRIAVWSTAVLAVLAVIGSVGAALAAVQARTSLSAGADAAQAGFASARRGEQDEAVAHFEQARAQFAEADSALTAPWVRLGQAVPFVGQQTKAAQSMASSGLELSNAAIDVAAVGRYDEIRPAGGSVDLQLVGALETPAETAAASLAAAESRMTDAASGWLLSPVSEPLDEFLDEVADARPDADTAVDALRLAPGMLGGEGPRRYFVAFGTPAETRGLGGFVGAYGELTAQDGNVEFSQSGRVADLVDFNGDQVRALSGPETYLARYGRFQPTRFFQNVTAAPDFPTVRSVIGELYPQTPVGSVVDGAIYVDPIGLAALLELTGPVQVEGLEVPLTSENAAAFLLRDQYQRFGPNSDERDDFISDALDATFDALLDRELPGPSAIADVLGPAVEGGHLMFSVFDEDTESFLAALGLTGSFPEEPPGDLLSVRSSNRAPNKIDAYLRRDIAYDVTFDPETGEVEGTATITLHNDAPASGLPDYVIGNRDQKDSGTGPPRGTNMMWLSVYSRLELQSASVDGRDLPMQIESEYGSNVFSAEIEIPAQQQAVVVLDLDGRISTEPDYHLTLPRQALAAPDQVTVTVRSGVPEYAVDEPATESLELVEPTTLDFSFRRR